MILYTFQDLAICVTHWIPKRVVELLKIGFLETVFVFFKGLFLLLHASWLCERWNTSHLMIKTCLKSHMYIWTSAIYCHHCSFHFSCHFFHYSAVFTTFFLHNWQLIHWFSDSVLSYTFSMVPKVHFINWNWYLLFIWSNIHQTFKNSFYIFILCEFCKCSTEFRVWFISLLFDNLYTFKICIQSCSIYLQSLLMQQASKIIAQERLKMLRIDPSFTCHTKQMGSW